MLLLPYYTAVTATRNLKELYSNYAAVESSFTGLGSGATLKFALKTFFSLFY